MSIILVSKCGQRHIPATSFDSLDIHIRPRSDYLALASVFPLNPSELTNPPPPFDGCNLDSIPPEGRVAYACAGPIGDGLGWIIVGNYSLPYPLKKGVWEFHASVAPTSGFPRPQDDPNIGIYKDVYLSFLGAGLNVEDQSLLPYLAQDGSPLSITFNVDYWWSIDFGFPSDPDDPCSCDVNFPSLGFEIGDPGGGIIMYQNATVRFSGKWISDPPP